MSDILQLQEYLFYGLRSCALFDDFNVVLERQFLAESEIRVESLYMTPRRAGGRIGAGLLVEMPRLQTPKPNSLQRNLVASIVAIEQRNVNFLKGGSGVACEELAERALDFMYGWVMGFSSALSPEAGGVAPAPETLNGPGLVCLRAQVSLRREHRPVGRCATPAIGEPEAGTFTLATATEGAVIYYTLDQSLPGRENGQAVIYVGPVALGPGAIITYAAWRDDLLPSHVSSQWVS